MNIQTCKTPLISGAKLLRSVLAPALLALGAATAALTPIRILANDFSAQSERVSLANLDLNSVKGARTAYARIKAAAWSVCGESTMAIEVMVRGPGECVQATLARTVLDVHSVELSKLYIRRNGSQMAALYGVTTPIVTAGNTK